MNKCNVLFCKCIGRYLLKSKIMCSFEPTIDAKSSCHRQSERDKCSIQIVPPLGLSRELIS